MSSYQADVLIADAGPSALALAIELGQRGICCIVFDNPSSSAKDQGHPVDSPRTRDHFRRWGIGGDRVQQGALKAHAASLPTVALYARDTLRGFVQDTDAVRSDVQAGGAGAVRTITSHYLVSAPDALPDAQYRDGRVFTLGGAPQSFGVASDFAFGEAVEDGVDLGWKLAAVLRGWGGASLLDSYPAERRPRQAPAQEADRPAAANVPRRGRPACTLAHGATAPHFLMHDGRSLHDGFGPEFTLLSTGGWAFADLMLAQEEARELGFPLKVLQAKAPALQALYGARLALIRPDRRVAWHGDAWPYEGKQLLRQVTGHGAGPA